jgi:hypothetical protein
MVLLIPPVEIGLYRFTFFVRGLKHRGRRYLCGPRHQIVKEGVGGEMGGQSAQVMLSSVGCRVYVSNPSSRILSVITRPRSSWRRTTRPTSHDI